jgi:hypothetical protein
VPQPAAQANPFLRAAQASPSERPAPPNPFVQSARSVEQPAVAEPSTLASSPVAPSVHANPVQASPVAPSVHVNPVQASPIAPPVRASIDEASPVAPSVHASPVEASPVEASAVAPSAHASAIAASKRSEQPVYIGAAAPPEDVNPIVRPAEASAAGAHVEQAVQMPPVAPRVIETHVQTSAAGAQVEAISADTFERPKVESPAGDPLADPPLAASALQLPVDQEPVVRSRLEANAFETAPTEFAGTETPIAQTDGHGSSERADLPSVESPERPQETEATGAPAPAASAPSNPESVVSEGEIQDQPAVAAQTFSAPRPFTSSGSEMPVVITTPAPHRRRGASASQLLGLGRELLPQAQAWSRKTLRTAPRALVIGAPLLALLGIWAVRSLVSHPKHTAVAEVRPPVADVAAATPAPQTGTSPTTATPASAILVSTATAPSAAPPAADAAELASAISHGLPALEALARKFPNDPQVGIALATQQAQAQRFEAAVESVERVIASDPKAAQSGKVMGILWRAAQSSAREPSFSAFRKLGARGSDIEFDLATTAGVRDSVRERAKLELTKSLSPDASADTRVATALLLAPDCSTRKALLSRAEHEGGKRTQTMLEQFSRGSVCTSSTDEACNSCLTGSPALAHALAHVNAGGEK